MEWINFTSAGAISQRAKERMQRRDQEHREMLRQQVADGLFNEEEARERGAKGLTGTLPSTAAWRPRGARRSNEWAAKVITAPRRP